MTGSRLIRISSRATGEKRHVRVYIYADLEQMRAAGTAFNGQDHATSAGMVQAYCDQDGRLTLPIIRLAATHLGSRIVSHEVHHAATGIYGATLDAQTPTEDVLNHYNEGFAYLYSDLFTSLIRALHRHGYYDQPKETP